MLTFFLIALCLLLSTLGLVAIVGYALKDKS